jgi:hypothetical protein
MCLRRHGQLFVAHRAIITSARSAETEPRQDGGRTLPDRSQPTSSSGEGDSPAGATPPPLEPGETIATLLRGIGSTLYLTPDRMIVARDGVERRPRSGIQSFPIDELRHVRLERGSGPSGRIVVWAGGTQEAVSMFFEPRSQAQAETFVAETRAAIARRRRAGDPPGTDGGDESIVRD